jgi:kanosamine-6-phosphate phosphatase
VNRIGSRRRFMRHFAGSDSHIRSLPELASVRRAVFCDFDETYLAHSPSGAQHRALAELERYLWKHCTPNQLLFGWVTGSSLASVMAKVQRYGLTVLPHFVASALGTQITFFRDGVAHPDDDWRVSLQASGYSSEAVAAAVAALAELGIALAPQTQITPSGFRHSYYHASRGADQDGEAIAQIRAVAAARAIGVNVSRCNPAAGDPAHCFDVDFLPTVCGKANVVAYVCRRFGVERSATLGFGDSGNDLEMLEAVGHGVLVGNSTAEARTRFARVSEYHYAEAILRTLRQHLDARAMAASRGPASLEES